MLRIFPIYQSKSGCDYHRIRLPFMLSGDYIDQDFYKDFTLDKAFHFFLNSEILVYNRAFPTDKMKLLQSKGVKMVCDVDDYWVLHHEHPLYDAYSRGLMNVLIQNMKMADMVTTTTQRLAERIRSYNANVVVIPNAIPFGYGQFQEGDKGSRFIYTGLSSHGKDVALLNSAAPQLRTIEGLQFALAGYEDNPVFRDMFSTFSKAGECAKLSRLPLDYYMDCYDGAGAVLVPLVNNNFNAHKSNLKMLEAAAKKLPAIISFVPPYSDDHAAPVLWVKHRSDWYKHIKALHESEAMRLDYGERLHEWALKNYSMLYWNKVRFEAYKSLLN